MVDPVVCVTVLHNVTMSGHTICITTLREWPAQAALSGKHRDPMVALFPKPLDSGLQLNTTPCDIASKVKMCNCHKAAAAATHSTCLAE